MSQEKIASHLRKLRGDILEGEVFFIDGQPLKALVDFNVYTEQNRLQQALKVLHKKPSYLSEYAEWLIEENKVCPQVGLTNGPDVAVYRTFPFCPDYRAVLKTAVIMTSCLADVDLLSLTTYDIYVHTLMRDRIKEHEFDQSKSYSENLGRLINSLNMELRLQEDQWMMDNLGHIVDLQREGQNAT